MIQSMTAHTQLPSLAAHFRALHLPAPNSHKGQNGKLLIIGGSDLFHVASKWSLDIASRCVDMVFYSSVPSNNVLVQAAKGAFWNGIVVPRDQLESYLQEADCVLIGPGMTRTVDTQEIVNTLLQKYPQKKWVIDAGALQMVNPSLLNAECIITPHQQEFLRVFEKIQLDSDLAHFLEGIKATPPTELAREQLVSQRDMFLKTSQALNGSTIILKGKCDIVARFVGESEHSTFEIIEGGNGGMTKGGTGDVLAGLVAGLYCNNSAVTAALVASFVCKAAGDHLYQTVGPFFNASDLVEAIPPTLWSAVQSSSS